MRVPACVPLCAVFLAAQVPAQPRSGMLDVGDARLRYEVSGNGPALVFINGWALNYSAWDDQVVAFAPRYRVVRYDLRGFGKSTGDADRSRDADDLRILMDSLRIRSASIVGLSRGGSIAADFAVRWPERVTALVLYGAGAPADFPVRPEPRPVALMADIVRRFGIDSLRSWIAGSPIAWYPPERPEAGAKIRRTLADYDGRDLLDPRPESGRVPPATLSALSRLRLPVLVIRGDHEAPFLQTVADSLVQRIPGAHRAVIANAGHGAHVAQPEAFNAALAAFLRSAGLP